MTDQTLKDINRAFKTLEERGELLDRIRAEIEEVAEEEIKIDKKWAQGLKYALKIIDKYKVKSEGLNIPNYPLEQDPCEDVISRQSILDDIARIGLSKSGIKEVQAISECLKAVEASPPVTPQSKIGRCKDCKYFEYDSMENVNGIPIIVAHEICSKWGRGCKTMEDGYCFMFEPQENDDEKVGKWIYNPETDLANCSNCGASCPSDKYGRIEVNECPNCGAKMG